MHSRYNQQKLNMVERFLRQTHFESVEDYNKHLAFIIPEHFNFAYDVMDQWAEERPDGPVAMVEIREGKFHQIKRMFKARGREVTRLKRLSMGPLALDEALLPGQWRRLTAEEIRSLKGEQADCI